MGVNISGWDDKCSSGCDRFYNANISDDPDPNHKKEYREIHLRCLNACFKTKKLSDRSQFLK
jgi:hypothetical protein